MKTIGELQAVLGAVLQTDPQNHLFRNYQAQALMIIAEVRERSGQLDEALKVRRDRLAVLDRLVQDLPDRKDFAELRDEESKTIAALQIRIDHQAKSPR